MFKRTTALMVMGLLSVGTPSLAPDVDSPPFPPSWWNDDNHDFWTYAHWEVPPGANPANPPNDATHFASSWLKNTDFSLVVTGLDVKITLNNAYIEENRKVVFIYVKGKKNHGLFKAPRNFDLDFGDTPQGSPEPTVIGGGGTGGGHGFNFGVWTATLKVTIKPQPDKVIWTFTMPEGSVIQRAWAGEICDAIEGEGCPLDLNGDGILNLDDVPVLFASWGQCPGCAADYNADGVVDLSDHAIMIHHDGPFVDLCWPDLDASDDVGTSDLVALLSAWGECAPCQADLDASGDVGAVDLLILLAAWGPCP